MSTDRTPTIDQFRPVVLRVLADRQIRHSREISELAAKLLGLDDKTRAETIPSGLPRYINRANWACSSFIKAGLLIRPKRGYYQITDDGLKVNKRNLSSYSEKDMLEWPAWADYQAEIEARKSGQPTASTPDSADGPDPIEVMADAERAFNAETETDLRKRLQESSPEFFEKAVIELLWAMGYGGAHGEKQHVGRSGDGGIDGIIRQDALGLTNIYIQAKRYADTNKVGAPEIRNFIGSLDSQGANLGVFITTSSFLPAAQQSAENYRHGKIVLINGIKLTTLMLTYGVGVQKTREYTLYEIDEDFFEDDLA